MRMLLTAALAVFAAPVSAQDWSAPAPSRARWDVQASNGARYLRATSEDGEGRAKLLFLCNEEHLLVVMAMIAAGEVDETTFVASPAIWVIDGTPSPDASPPASRTIMINGAAMSLLSLSPATYRRLGSAAAAGIAWRDGGGVTHAAFQVGLAEGREPLAAFARACNAQAYPRPL